ncbi:MAG: TrkH family potassium uptake protein [bacterium]|nr:TrkH family potassium uptake protein [bacterium]
MSFFLLIIIGTILLSLPWAVKGPSLYWVDSLFTATSATCVTGLSVWDTGTKFTFFGQIVILVLIQLGGLGIMTFSTFFAVVLGKKITIKDHTLIKESLSSFETERIVILLKYVLIFTISAEFLGALCLYFCWEQSTTCFNPIYCSIFHSVSAFCNAGFSLFTNSLIDYKSNKIINFIITSLIILGGIGFIVINDLRGIWKRKDKYNKKVSLHTKIVIFLTVSIVLFSTCMLFIFENNNAFSGLTLFDKFQAAYFQAITSRTAGFNTIDTALLSSAGLFFIIILMFIGGASGSTAGGIKVNTLGVIYGMIKAIFKGRDRIELFHRTISRNIGYKAISILILSLLVVIIGVVSLLITENIKGESIPFINILFEVVSAFGTVGLSTGITSKLSLIGKLIITMIMFAGRIGPLTLALAITEEKVKLEYRYPEEKVIVG